MSYCDTHLSFAATGFARAAGFASGSADFVVMNLTSLAAGAIATLTALLAT